MRPQAGIKRHPECTTPRVVVDPLRVQQPGNSVGVQRTPSRCQEALVQVCLDSFQLRIVLRRVQVPLGAFRLAVFLQVRPLKARPVPDRRIPRSPQLRGRELPQLDQRVKVAENASFVPLHLDPRGIAKNQIEAALRPAVATLPVKDVCECQVPVKEPPLPRQPVHELQPRVRREQLLDVQHPALGHDPLRQLARVRGVFRAKQVARLPETGLGAANLTGQHQADLAEEVLAGWKLLDRVQRPEPEGAPVVHHQLEPAVRARRAPLRAEHALAPNRFLPAVGRPSPVRIPAPDPDVILGGPAVSRELLDMQRPEPVRRIR